MKKLVIILLLIINAPFAEAQTSDLSINEDTVRKLLFDLAADDMEGRAAGTAGIEKAAVYLETFLRENRIQPYFGSYRDTISTFAQPTVNIVGFIPGNDSLLKNEVVILSAHYDHIGIGQGGGDVINNGANDDASGVVVVAELARSLARSKTNGRSIMVVFFTAEEKGLLGSRHLAEKLKGTDVNLYTMLNFEMVGIPMKRDYTAYLSGYDRSNMAAVINKYAGKQLIGYFAEEVPYKLFMRSDNYPFFKTFGIPAQTICTFDFTNYEYYHHVDDEPERMDIAHMTMFTRAILPVIEKISNAPEREIKLND